MKKVLLLASCLALGACATTDSIRDIPDGPGKGPEIIEKEVPVPVPCKVTVTAPALSIRGVPADADLEDQNASLRATIAEQAVFITDLVAGLIGCGGTVIDSSK